MGDTNYLANVTKKLEDVEHHGVKGMKWGIRNKKGTATASSETTAPSASETPSERYTRLLGHAKQHGANSLNEDELKFVTQRGDALTKVDRLNSTNPNWVQDAAKQALKQAGKKSMQMAVNHVTQKYIGVALGSKPAKVSGPPRPKKTKPAPVGFQSTKQ